MSRFGVILVVIPFVKQSSLRQNESFVFESPAFIVITNQIQR